jgi:hypothetical protein
MNKIDKEKFFINPRKEDLGRKAFSVYHGTDSDHARGMSTWHETFNKKDAKQYIKEHQKPEWKEK